jgi:ATP-dependent DNA ligase
MRSFRYSHSCIANGTAAEGVSYVRTDGRYFSGSDAARFRRAFPVTRVAVPHSKHMLQKPMPLVLLAEPFDHPDWVFELKHDGFRALAHIDGHHCRLVSRRGHVFRKWDVLREEIAHSIRANHAVLDGEIVCLEPDGRSNFYKLMFRRDWPYFYAYDALSIDGDDLRQQALIERKRRLRAVMPRIDSLLLYVDHLRERGCALFRAVCQRDLEGIISKWRDGRYETDGVSTSWVKIKNTAYLQLTGRRELFERRRDQRQAQGRDWRRPELRLTPAPA